MRPSRSKVLRGLPVPFVRGCLVPLCGVEREIFYFLQTKFQLFVHQVFYSPERKCDFSLHMIDICHSCVVKFSKNLLQKKN